MRPKELARRLERLTALRGVGVHDLYASMGENGYWSGGYFVPERTFCAVPSGQHPSASLFSRHVIEDAADEIAAHTSLFKPDGNPGYDSMTEESARLVVNWFCDDTELYDDPKFAVPPPPEEEEVEVEAVEQALGGDGKNDVKDKGDGKDGSGMEDGEESIPDESPIDIAAAASLVPLPDDEGDGMAEGSDLADAKEADNREEKRKAYLQHLFSVAQQAGSNARSYLPSGKFPAVSMPKGGMPTLSVPSMPTLPSIPKVPSVGMPSLSIFSKKDPNAPVEGTSIDKSEALGEEKKEPVGGDSTETTAALADSKENIRKEIGG
jgi:hypothetical protein